MRAVWYSMSVFQLGLRLAPKWTWELFVEQIAQGDPATTAWVVGELRRGNPEAMAEAGRDIGRFDSRSWIGVSTTPGEMALTRIRCGASSLARPRVGLLTAALAAILSPITSMAFSGGPRKAIPASAQAAAKWEFSERKP